MIGVDAAPRPTEVLKVGGAILNRPECLAEFVAHVARRAAERTMVVVHGGGVLISELHAQLGLETTKHNGLRATPTESMKAVAMALRGAANSWLVGHLVARGVPALGVSGVDLGLMRSAFLDREKLGRVGGPPRVDSRALRGLLDQAYVPVIAPVCLGPDGGLLNVNADTVAQAVAAALGAASLDFVSDVPGVYEAAGRVRRRIRGSELEAFLEEAEVRGGMVPKLRASLAAVSAGVGRVRIGTLSSLESNHATEVVL